MIDQRGIDVIRDLIDSVDMARRLHFVRQRDAHRNQRLAIDSSIDRAHAYLREHAQTPSEAKS